MNTFIRGAPPCDHWFRHSANPDVPIPTACPSCRVDAPKTNTMAPSARSGVKVIPRLGSGARGTSTGILRELKKLKVRHEKGPTL